MQLYFIAGILSAILMSLYTKKHNNFFIIVSFLLLFLIIAFRYGIGYDYLNIYDKIFKYIISGRESGWEIGMVILCKIIGNFTNDSFPMFFITALITYFFFYKAIIKNSKIPWLSVLLIVIYGFFMDSMNAVRQYVAISIFLYSIKFIKDKQHIKYIFSILIASCFHFSALFLIPIYYLCNTYYSKVKIFIVLCFLILVFPFTNYLFFYLIKFIKYSSYLNTNYNSANPTYSELIVSFVIMIFYLVKYNKYHNNKEFKLNFILTCLFFVSSIFSFRIILAYRIVMYFKITILFTVPYIISIIHNSRNRLLMYISLILFFSAITLIGTYKFSWYDTKYISIFDK